MVITKYIRIAVILVALAAAAFIDAAAQNYATSDTVTEYPNKGTYYHDKFEGRKTANGEIFDQNAFTAAHWRIKMGTHILVTNQNTGLQVIVRVNDRCPKRGVIDLSHRAATAIGIRGCQPVTVRLLPSGYEKKCLAQDKVFDSVYSPMHPDPSKASKPADKATESTVAKNQPQDNATPKQAATAATKGGNTSECYNLILCNVASHGEAYNNVLKLPVKYQEKALVEPLEENSIMRVSIEVNLPIKQAEELLTSLKKTFPNAEIVPCR